VKENTRRSATKTENLLFNFMGKVEEEYRPNKQDSLKITTIQYFQKKLAGTVFIYNTYQIMMIGSILLIPRQREVIG
jgi:hypothetical protein